MKKVCVSLPTVSSACWEDIYGGEAETECEPHQVRFQGRVQGWARVQRRGEQGAGAKEAAHSHSHLPEAHVQQTVPGGDRFLRRETAGEIPSQSLLASSLSQSAAIALDESLQEQAPFLSESAFCGHTVSFGSSSFTKEKQVSFQEGQCRLAPWSAVQQSQMHRGRLHRCDRLQNWVRASISPEARTHRKQLCVRRRKPVGLPPKPCK